MFLLVLSAMSDRLFKSKRQARRQRARDRVNKRARAPLQIRGLKGRLLEALAATMTPRRSLLAEALTASLERFANVASITPRPSLAQHETMTLRASLLVANLFDLTSREAKVLVESFVAQYGITFLRLYELVSRGDVRLCSSGSLEWTPEAARMRWLDDTTIVMPPQNEPNPYACGRSFVGVALPSQWNQPKPCVGCCNYHGQTYGGNFLVCGMHASGWDGETCPDWEGYGA